MKKKKAIDRELNSLLKKILELYKPIDSPTVNIYLFPLNNIYKRPPRLVFRFANHTEEDYLKIGKILNDFKGNLEWTITRVPESRTSNHLIEPKQFSDLRNLKSLADRKTDTEIIEILGGQYYEICDKAVLDIKLICQKLKKELK